MTPATIRPRSRIELWVPPARPARRCPAPQPVLLPPLPPPPLEQQEAAIFAELACWGRERLI